MEKGLRELRISAGMEIDDISGKTGITRRYLTAIENGDFEALPGDIYARGYIRDMQNVSASPLQRRYKNMKRTCKERVATRRRQPRKKSGKAAFCLNWNVSFTTNRDRRQVIRDNPANSTLCRREKERGEAILGQPLPFFMDYPV